MIGRSDGGFAGGVLGLTDEMRQHGAKPTWLGYIGVDDVDATVAQIEAKGGKALMPAFDIPQGRIAMVADPQGNPFYVMKPVPPEGSEKKESDVFSVDQEQRVGWNELSTPDPVAARQFYGELFGWTSDDFMDMGEFGEYRFFDHGEHEDRRGVCGVLPAVSPGWRYYIRVPSIPQAVEAVKAGGGTVSPRARRKCQAATKSSSATTRRAPNSPWSARRREIEQWPASSEAETVAAEPSRGGRQGRSLPGRVHGSYR